MRWPQGHARTFLWGWLWALLRSEHSVMLVAASLIGIAGAIGVIAFRYLIVFGQRFFYAWAAMSSALAMLCSCWATKPMRKRP